MGVNSDDRSTLLIGRSINSFVDELSLTSLDGNSFNQYAFDSICQIKQANAIRRYNLQHYLKQMAALHPAVMLVGEAPGYRGCRITGIPFTSEFLLVKGVSNEPRQHDHPWSLLGHKQGFKKTIEPNQPNKEATATMVWDVICGLDKPPLLWNAFPFHPHKPGDLRKNRAPLVPELNIGRQFVLELKNIFSINLVIAVGNKAYTALSQADICAHHVRHPSFGGKSKFVQGLHQILSDNQSVLS